MLGGDDMPGIGARIKDFRKEIGLSQTDFGANIGVGIGVIRNFEAGYTVPSSVQIDLICKTYHVNRVWLETGEGDMFVEQTRDERIAAFVGQALSDESDDFKRQLIGLLAALDEDGWQKLKAAAESLKKASENSL